MVGLMSPIEIRCGMNRLFLDYGAAKADDRGNGLTIKLLPESVIVSGFGTVSITNYTISALVLNATALADTVCEFMFSRFLSFFFFFVLLTVGCFFFASFTYVVLLIRQVLRS